MNQMEKEEERMTLIKEKKEKNSALEEKDSALEEKFFAPVHSMESFGSVDGPGIRFVVFLQGCAMRCQYCHNPDTWKITDENRMSPEEILRKALSYRAYWGEKGGITVSGGDPLLHIDFLLALFRLAKDKGINCCLDTSAQPFTREEPYFSKFLALMKLTDTVLLDIKAMDEKLHYRLTGHSNKNILDCGRLLSELAVPVWIRHVLVPGRTDSEEELLRLKDYIHSLKNVAKVEILPYHTLGVGKYESLGIPYPLKGISPASKEDVKRAEEILGI